jgi:hypothetical protein
MISFDDVFLLRLLRNFRKFSSGLTQSFRLKAIALVVQKTFLSLTMDSLDGENGG